MEGHPLLSSFLNRVWSFCGLCSRSERACRHHSALLQRTMLSGRRGPGEGGSPVPVSTLPLPEHSHHIHRLQGAAHLLFLICSSQQSCQAEVETLQMGKVGPERLSNMPELTQPINGRDRFKARHFHTAHCPPMRCQSRRGCHLLWV